jgi:hypothetical protein
VTTPGSALPDGMTHQIFDRPPLAERLWLLRALRGETIGGVLLLAAAIIAIAWANSPWGDAYFELGAITVGPEALGLNLTLATWAADGLLAVFFFVAGLELKHELTHGTLSKPAQAAVPIAAAIGGMVIPAVIFVAIVSTSMIWVRSPSLRSSIPRASRSCTSGSQSRSSSSIGCSSGAVSAVPSSTSPWRSSSGGRRTRAESMPPSPGSRWHCSRGRARTRARPSRLSIAFKGCCCH